MADPFSILADSQVDVPSLINAYTARKRQDIEDQYRQAAFQQQQAQLARQQKLDARGDVEYGRQENARDLIAKGGKPADVIAADPALGFQYATHAAGIEKAQREAQGARAHAVGNAAMFVSRLPQDQQPAAWDQTIEQLVGQGYTDLAEYKGHYDPKALPGLIAASEDASKAYFGESDKDRDYAESVRSHRASEGAAAGNLAVAEGHLAISGRVDARAASAPAGVYPVQSRADYDSLPHGTHYSAPDGTVRIKP